MRKKTLNALWFIAACLILFGILARAEDHGSRVKKGNVDIGVSMGKARAWRHLPDGTTVMYAIGEYDDYGWAELIPITPTSHPNYVTLESNPYALAAEYKRDPQLDEILEKLQAVIEKLQVVIEKLQKLNKDLSKIAARL